MNSELRLLGGKVVSVENSVVTVEGVSQEVKEIIGDFNKVMIVPIKEVSNQDYSLLSNGKSLRDVLLLQDPEILKEEWVSIDILDKCVSYLEKIEVWLKNGGEVSCELLNWMRFWFEIHGMPGESWEDPESGEWIDATIGNYTQGRFIDLIYGYDKGNRGFKEVGEYGGNIATNRFSEVMKLVDGKPVVCEGKGELEGLVEYVNECLELGNEILYGSLDSYFKSIESERNEKHDLEVWGYDTSKEVVEKLREMGENKVADIVDKMYEGENKKMYESENGNVIFTLEVNNEDVKVVDWSDKYLGMPASTLNLSDNNKAIME